MGYNTQIINKIKELKLTSTEIADALDKKGWIKGILPLNADIQTVGKCYFVYTYETNWHLHKQIQNAPRDSIVYIYPQWSDYTTSKDIAVMGHLVSKYLVEYKHVNGIVVNGFIRDANEIKKNNYPVWALGYCPLGVRNHHVEIPISKKIDLDCLKEFYNESIMVCDLEGVVCISKEDINEHLLNKLDWITNQETDWFAKLEEGKSTFEIVCKNLAPN